MSLAPLGGAGARLRLSASTDAAHRTVIDRVVSYQPPDEGQAPTQAAPLELLCRVIEDAAQTVLSPAPAIAGASPAMGLLAP